MQMVSSDEGSSGMRGTKEIYCYEMHEGENEGMRTAATETGESRAEICNGGGERGGGGGGVRLGRPENRVGYGGSQRYQAERAGSATRDAGFKDTESCKGTQVTYDEIKRETGWDSRQVLERREKRRKEERAVLKVSHCV